MGVEAARARAARRARRRRADRSGSPPSPRPTSTRPTPPRSTPRCGSPRDVPALRRRRRRSARRSARCALALDGARHHAGRQRRHPHRPARQRRRGRRRRRRRRARSSATTADGPVLAELPRQRRAPPRSSSTAGAPRATPARRSWEERFGEITYVPLGEQAWNAALKAAGARRRPRSTASSSPAPHARAVARRSAKKLGVERPRRRRPRRRPSATPAPRSPALLLAAAARAAPSPARSSRWSCWPTAPTCCCSAPPTRSRRTGRRAAGRRRRSAAGAPIAVRQVPRAGGACSRSSRPAGPSRPGSRRRPRPRSEDWKFGFVGSSRDDDRRRAPAARGPRRRHRRRTAARWPTRTGTIVTFTIDRLAYSPSPPVVFAVVDFDGGGRLPVELTDVDADEVAIGDRVEMTFRRLFTADGIHNYFWKAQARSRLMGSPRHQGPGRDRRHGLHAASPSTGTRASTTC